MTRSHIETVPGKCRALLSDLLMRFAPWFAAGHTAIAAGQRPIAVVLAALAALCSASVWIRDASRSTIGCHIAEQHIRVEPAGSCPQRDGNLAQALPGMMTVAVGACPSSRHNGVVRAGLTTVLAGSHATFANGMRKQL